MTKIVLSAEKIQEYIDYGKFCKKTFHMSVPEGTIEVSNGLIIKFVPTENGDIALRTNRSATGAWPKARIIFNPVTGRYSSRRSSSFEKEVVELFKGIMLKGLYDIQYSDAEKKDSEETDTNVPTHEHNVLPVKKVNSTSKARSKNSGITSWSPAAQSPKTGHKKFTRPEKQVQVKGYIRRTKDGREIFVRGYDRYRDRPENTEVKEYRA